jgi:hypothetical protein
MGTLDRYLHFRLPSGDGAPGIHPQKVATLATRG